MKTQKTFQHVLLVVGILFTTLAGYSFMSAAWTAPPAGVPPANNVDAPINVGSVDQVKDAGLGVDTLAVYGSSTFLGVPILSRTAPMIKFTDTDANSVDFWTHVNNNTFYILADRTNTGSWSGMPHPMRIVIDDNPANDYAQFSNKIRASEYCDQSGNECISPSDLQDILAFSDLRSYTQTSNPQNLNSPGGSSDLECSCNSGDVLTACNAGVQPGDYYNADGIPSAILNKNGCYTEDTVSPQCTCLTTTPAPGNVFCTVKFDYQFGKNVPVSTKYIRYITPDPSNEWAVAMYAHKDDWANPPLIMSQLIISQEWGGGDIAFGIGGDAPSKGHGGVVNASTYRLGAGIGRSNGQTYDALDPGDNWEVDAFNFINGETARVQVTDIFEGTAWISATVQDCSR